MRKQNRPTRHPGIHKLKSGGFRVRLAYRDPRTGLRKEIDREYPELQSIHEAARKREELREQALLGNFEASRERLKLKDYARSWLSGKRRTLERSTLARYASALDLHILPEFGEFYVDALTHRDGVLFRDNHPRGPVTVNSDLRVFKAMLADAVVDLDLPKNPLARVASLPEPPTYSDEDPNVLYPTEVWPFLEAAKQRVPEFFPVFATQVFTGMRPGEATALLWADVDFDKRIIRVRRAQYRGTTKDRTKTKRNRTIAMPDELVAILKEHRRLLVETQARGVEKGICFPNTKGDIRGTTTLRLPLQKATAAAGIGRRLTPQGLRRTYNNLLRQVTTLTVRQSMTGHSTERMAEHYSHVHPDEKLAAADGISRLVVVTSGDGGGDAN